jgi:hypothetical protein
MKSLNAKQALSAWGVALLATPSSAQNPQRQSITIMRFLWNQNKFAIKTLISAFLKDETAAAAVEKRGTHWTIGASIAAIIFGSYSIYNSRDNKPSSAITNPAEQIRHLGRAYCKSERL